MVKELSTKKIGSSPLVSAPALKAELKSHYEEPRSYATGRKFWMDYGRTSTSRAQYIFPNEIVIGGKRFNFNVADRRTKEQQLMHAVAEAHFDSSEPYFISVTINDKEYKATDPRFLKELGCAKILEESQVSTSFILGGTVPRATSGELQSFIGDMVVELHQLQRKIDLSLFMHALIGVKLLKGTFKNPAKLSPEILKGQGDVLEAFVSWLSGELIENLSKGNNKAILTFGGHTKYKIDFSDISVSGGLGTEQAKEAAQKQIREMVRERLFKFLFLAKFDEAELKALLGDKKILESEMFRDMRFPDNLILPSIPNAITSNLSIDTLARQPVQASPNSELSKIVEDALSEEIADDSSEMNTASSSDESEHRARERTAFILRETIIIDAAMRKAMINYFNEVSIYVGADTLANRQRWAYDSANVDDDIATQLAEKIIELRNGNEQDIRIKISGITLNSSEIAEFFTNEQNSQADASVLSNLASYLRQRLIIPENIEGYRLGSPRVNDSLVQCLMEVTGKTKTASEDSAKQLLTSCLLDIWGERNLEKHLNMVFINGKRWFPNPLKGDIRQQLFERLVSSEGGSVALKFDIRTLEFKYQDTDDVVSKKFSSGRLMRLIKSEKLESELDKCLLSTSAIRKTYLMGHQDGYMNVFSTKLNELFSGSTESSSDKGRLQLQANGRAPSSSYGFISASKTTPTGGELTNTRLHCFSALSPTELRADVKEDWFSFNAYDSDEAPLSFSSDGQIPMLSLVHKQKIKAERADDVTGIILEVPDFYVQSHYDSGELRGYEKLGRGGSGGAGCEYDLVSGASLSFESFLSDDALDRLGVDQDDRSVLREGESATDRQLLVKGCLDFISGLDAAIKMCDAEIKRKEEIEIKPLEVEVGKIDEDTGKPDRGLLQREQQLEKEIKNLSLLLIKKTRKIKSLQPSYQQRSIRQDDGIDLASASRGLPSATRRRSLDGSDAGRRLVHQVESTSSARESWDSSVSRKTERQGERTELTMQQIQKQLLPVVADQVNLQFELADKRKELAGVQAKLAKQQKVLEQKLEKRDALVELRNELKLVRDMAQPTYVRDSKQLNRYKHAVKGAIETAVHKHGVDEHTNESWWQRMLNFFGFKTKTFKVISRAAEKAGIGEYDESILEEANSHSFESSFVKPAPVSGKRQLISGTNGLFTSAAPTTAANTTSITSPEPLVTSSSVAKPKPVSDSSVGFADQQPGCEERRPLPRRRFGEGKFEYMRKVYEQVPVTMVQLPEETTQVAAALTPLGGGGPR